MENNEQAFTEIADLLHEIRNHYQLALWHTVRNLPYDAAEAVGKADEACRRLFEITDARGL